MREAIGGAWLYYLVVTFLLIYVFFMSFIMNYASASRAANYVITQIENCQARNGDCPFGDLSTVFGYIREKYHYVAADNRNYSKYVCCIDNGGGSVYRVELPIDFYLPMIGNIGVIKVKSESKTIQNFSCADQKIGSVGYCNTKG